MTTQYKHPMRDMKIRVWQPLEDGEPYLAFIGNLPLKCTGETADEAANKATKFRDDAVDKHEAAYAARKQAAAERKAKATL